MLNFFNACIERPQFFQDLETLILNETFASSVPVGWTNNGFTVNNGLEASGTGSMTFKIEYSTNTFLDRCKTQVEFQVNDLTSSFGVAKNLAFRGNVAKIDFATSSIKLGILTTQDVQPVYEFSTTFANVAKVLGNTYVVELIKDRQKMIVRFYDKSLPGNVDELVRNYDIDNAFAGSNWGPPAAIFFGGDIKITNFKYIALSPQAPKVAMYGDSITEGYTMIDQIGNISNRWSDKVWSTNRGNAYISAQGGINANGVRVYMDFELSALSPDYVIVLIGSNDNDFTTWNNNIDSIINKINNAGATPVLCTIPPRSDRQAFINSCNDELLNNRSLLYDIVDFAAAVTTNRDRLNWVSDYLLPDNVHPTIEGHQAMFDEIVNNNNYLI